MRESIPCNLPHVRKRLSECGKIWARGSGGSARRTPRVFEGTEVSFQHRHALQSLRGLRGFKLKPKSLDLLASPFALRDCGLGEPWTGILRSTLACGSASACEMSSSNFISGLERLNGIRNGLCAKSGTVKAPVSLTPCHVTLLIIYSCCSTGKINESCLAVFITRQLLDLRTGFLSEFSSSTAPHSWCW